MLIETVLIVLWLNAFFFYFHHCWNLVVKFHSAVVCRTRYPYLFFYLDFAKCVVKGWEHHHAICHLSKLGLGGLHPLYDIPPDLEVALLLCDDCGLRDQNFVMLHLGFASYWLAAIFWVKIWAITEVVVFYFHLTYVLQLWIRVVSFIFKVIFIRKDLLNMFRFWVWLGVFKITR